MMRFTMRLPIRGAARRVAGPVRCLPWGLGRLALFVTCGVFSIAATTLPVAARATIADNAAVRACVAAQAEAGAPAAECVNRAHAACLELGDAPAAATLCLRDAKEAWGRRIAARLDEVAAGAPGEIAQVARIEVRFDLLQNLLQCDRLEALALLRPPDEAALALQRARCEATATGLAYVKLLLQSRALDAGDGTGNRAQAGPQAETGVAPEDGDRGGSMDGAEVGRRDGARDEAEDGPGDGAETTGTERGTDHGTALRMEPRTQPGTERSAAPGAALGMDPATQPRPTPVRQDEIRDAAGNGPRGGARGGRRAGARRPGAVGGERVSMMDRST